MPDKFKNRYRSASARLANWDYSSNGAYSITICTENRKHYFGEIINAKMKFSPIGEYANKCWIDIPNHFPHFYLDEFIVMPNHIHGIVMIEKPCNDGNSKTNQNDVTPKHPRFRNQGRNTISAMVGSFKSAVTKYCNENKLPFGWQSRFHDHVIRDADGLFAIRNYIRHNPANWTNDEFHPPLASASPKSTPSTQPPIKTIR